MKINAETRSPREAKEDYWQYIRGLCILSVILIHSKSGIEYKGAIHGSWNFDYWLIMRQFINFPVAVFIFLAGYFTKIEIAENSNWFYIFERGKRLIIPFFIWSLFYTVIHVIAAHGNIEVAQIVKLLFLGLSAVQLYYILVLVQLTLLTPFLIKAIKTRNGSKVLFLVSPLYLISLYWYSTVFQTQLPFYQAFFPAWLLFYYAGLWLKIRGYPTIESIRASIIYCFTAVLVSIVEAYFLLAHNFTAGFASSQIKVSSFLYTFLLINLFIVVRPYAEKLNMSLLKLVGEYSYGIFFVHYFWILFISKFLARVTPVAESLPSYHIVQVLSVTVLSLISIIITQKVLGKHLSSKLLGF